jgi:hypothetical protein
MASTPTSRSPSPSWKRATTTRWPSCRCSPPTRRRSSRSAGTSTARSTAFVYHWVNNKKSCYNGCGFEQHSTNIKPGDTLAYDVTKKFGIKYVDGAWWIAFDTEWIGFFPETLWNDEGVSFNKSGYLQVFGEIAAAGTTSCTQMGNGTIPSLDATNTAARASSVSFVNGPAVNLYMRSSVPDQYAVVPYENSVRSFRYGGPLTASCLASTS